MELQAAARIASIRRHKKDLAQVHARSHVLPTDPQCTIFAVQVKDGLLWLLASRTNLVAGAPRLAAPYDDAQWLSTERNQGY